MLKIVGKKIFTIFAENLCLSKSVWSNMTYKVPYITAKMVFSPVSFITHCISYTDKKISVNIMI